jgi:hypothetical protein
MPLQSLVLVLRRTRCDCHSVVVVATRLQDTKPAPMWARLHVRVYACYAQCNRGNVQVAVAVTSRAIMSASNSAHEHTLSTQTDRYSVVIYRTHPASCREPPFPFIRFSQYGYGSTVSPKHRLPSLSFNHPPMTPWLSSPKPSTVRLGPKADSASFADPSTTAARGRTMASPLLVS